MQANSITSGAIIIANSNQNQFLAYRLNDFHVYQKNDINRSERRRIADGVKFKIEINFNFFKSMRYQTFDQIRNNIHSAFKQQAENTGITVKVDRKKAISRMIVWVSDLDIFLQPILADDEWIKTICLITDYTNHLNKI